MNIWLEKNHILDSIIRIFSHFFYIFCEKIILKGFNYIAKNKFSFFIFSFKLNKLKHEKITLLSQFFSFSHNLIKTYCLEDKEKYTIFALSRIWFARKILGVKIIFLSRGPQEKMPFGFGYRHFFTKDVRNCEKTHSLPDLLSVNKCYFFFSLVHYLVDISTPSTQMWHGAFIDPSTYKKFIYFFQFKYI